jgi:hypothetical protein
MSLTDEQRAALKMLVASPRGLLAVHGDGSRFHIRSVARPGARWVGEHKPGCRRPGEDENCSPTYHRGGAEGDRGMKRPRA